MKKYIILFTLTCTIISAKVDLKLSNLVGLGLFTELYIVVSSIMHFEHEGFNSITVDWSDPRFSYKDGYSNNNGWDLFFEPIRITNETSKEDTITTEKWTGFHELHSNCSNQWLRYESNLPYRLYAKGVINKYLKIKPFITDKVEQFYEREMKGNICIGVHIRYSRAVENRASLQEYAQEIDKIIQEHGTEKIKIFVASDSNDPIRYMKQRYGNKMVHTNAWRQEGTEDPVYSTPNYKLGFDAGVGALVDWLLLSKCDYFIHIFSQMSVFVSLYNPYIKDVFLPKGGPLIKCGADETCKNPYIHLINQ